MKFSAVVFLLTATTLVSAGPVDIHRRLNRRSQRCSENKALNNKANADGQGTWSSWSWSTSWSNDTPTKAEEEPEPTFEQPAFAPTTFDEPEPEPTSSDEPEPTTEQPEPEPEPSTEQPEPEPSTTKQSNPEPSQNSGGGGGSNNSDQEAYLSNHNDFRAKHGAGALKWSDELASAAQKVADTCVFEHSGGKFGENLAAGTGDSYDIAAAIKSWTDESTDYNPSNPTFSHFTQVVWKDTTEVGCALQMCDGIFDSNFGKAKYYVCEYNPAGNVIGRFDINVQA